MLGRQSAFVLLCTIVCQFASSTSVAHRYGTRRIELSTKLANKPKLDRNCAHAMSHNICNVNNVEQSLVRV